MIPASIWEVDSPLLTSWLKLHPKISRDSQRIITDFYLFVQKPILQVEESDLEAYRHILLQECSKNTADTYMRTIRRFYKYSKENNGNRNAHNRASE